MANDIAVIDRFLDIFSRYIDSGFGIAVIDRFLDIFSRYINSGFGLISGDFGFLVKILIGIDVVLAALAWAAGEDEVIQAFAKKVLYVGFFAFILNNWNSLAQANFQELCRARA